MSFSFHPPLAEPKNGQTYEIIAVCRVSDPGPNKQEWKSLDDQEHSCREVLESLKRPYQLTTISGSGSGEWLTRGELQRLTDEISTGKYDLVCSEDLGRIVRRMHAYLMCEHAEDSNTRLFAKNDHVDTGSANWR